MYKIHVDSRLRKESKVTLFKKKALFWVRQGSVVKDADPVNAIISILDKNNLKISDVSFFDCFPGPGSFTGLKIGFAVVNSFKWALGSIPYSRLRLPKYGAEPKITISSRTKI